MGCCTAGSDYTVFAVNPLQAARYRERHGTSGAKAIWAMPWCWRS